MSITIRSLTLSGGDMGWKQTLILGGAVLLLAACDRATAPIANVREGGVVVRKANTTTPTEPPTTSSDSTGQTTLPEDCPSGISILSGDGEVICVELDY
jgi:hypothetical protein